MKQFYRGDLTLFEHFTATLEVSVCRNKGEGPNKVIVLAEYGPTPRRLSGQVGQWSRRYELWSHVTQLEARLWLKESRATG